MTGLRMPPASQQQKSTGEEGDNVTEIELTGLDGSNPLGYFAALGCLAGLARLCPDAQPRLGWHNQMLPRPVLYSTGLASDEIVAALDADRQAWADAPALTFDGLPEIKLNAAQQRRYLLACRGAGDGGRSAELASALIAEGTFAKNGGGKPTDLHFCASRQKFLAIARSLQRDVTADLLREAVFGPWEYEHTSDRFATFGWDVSDDRVYAYGFSAPTSTVKQLVPGADWLGLVGLAALPVRGRGEQSLPPGASGSWKKGVFRWGLWSVPLDWAATRALLCTGMPPSRVAGFRTGVFRVYSARIRRTDRSGYGSFSPPRIVWDVTAGSPA